MLLLLNRKSIQFSVSGNVDKKARQLRRAVIRGWNLVEAIDVNLGLLAVLPGMFRFENRNDSSSKARISPLTMFSTLLHSSYCFDSISNAAPVR